MIAPAGRRELFVWYRVRSDRAEALRREVVAMQRALETAHPGLRARLLIRSDQSVTSTFMETYAADTEGAAGVDDGLQSTIEAAAAPLLASLDGGRHVEGFTAAVRD